MRIVPRLLPLPKTYHLLPVSYCILHLFPPTIAYFTVVDVLFAFLGHPALLTLASFRLFATDWRPFKRARKTILSFYTSSSSAPRCAVFPDHSFDQSRHAEKVVGFGTSLLQYRKGAYVISSSLYIGTSNINIFFYPNPLLVFIFFPCDIASRHSGRRW